MVPWSPFHSHRVLVRCIFAALLWLIAGPAVFTVSPAIAEIAPVILRDGKVIPAPPRGEIRLLSQNVVIRLEKYTATVDAVYQFANTGATSTQWVGFPKKASGSVPFIVGEDYQKYGFLRFDAWANGRRLDFPQRSCMQEDSENGSSVTFPKFKMLMMPVTVRYQDCLTSLSGIGT